MTTATSSAHSVWADPATGADFAAAAMARASSARSPASASGEDFAINDLFKLELKEEDYHRIIHGVKIYTPSLNCENQKLIKLYYLNKFIGIGIFENKFLRIKKLLI